MSDNWTEILRTHWGITAQLDPLDGEYDLNFRVMQSDGKTSILKVMRAGCDAGLIDMQIKALDHVAAQAPQVPMPRIIPANDGSAMITAKDGAGQARLIWLQSALPGICYARFSPHSMALIADLGAQNGRLTAALVDFDHPALARDFKWNLMQASWIKAELDCVTDTSRRAILAGICEEFDALQDDLAGLPPQAIHNDLNDYNALADHSTGNPRISGVIDLGDMCRAPRICDLAITAAYAVLDHPEPEQALTALVKGYHQVHPLTGAEIDMLLPLLRMRLAKSIVNSTLMAQENPDDPYITISQAPAWRFLEGPELNVEMLRMRLRSACGLPINDAAARVALWLDQSRGDFAQIIGQSLSDAPMEALSVEAATCPRNPFDITDREAATLGADRFGPDDIWMGYYSEPRLVYTAPAFRKGKWKASNRRTVHLGVDVFAPAGQELMAPMAATVAFVEDRRGRLDYGGMVILRHETPQGDAFHSLYGHLDPASIAGLELGQSIAKGEVFCRLGAADCNGGWAPHLHFQLALSLAGMGTDWPGVADPDELDLWSAICPNPAALLNLDDVYVAHQATDKNDILEKRQMHFGGNLKLSYSDPVMLMRGWKHHLFDEWGRPYLDAYNNVPHVGHAHPRIQAVVADQLLRMNSNTRYLHPAQTAFADKLMSKLPPELSVCWFLNSGTEANELALRLARAASGAKGMITPNHGYHGNTTGAIDISAYKFNAEGGVGQPDWVELVDIPDDYRGIFGRNDPDRGGKYAAQVDQAIAALADRGHRPAGFIAETFPSVGGQIIPPDGYLKGVYERIRAAGGICIADEVQTGLGRLGEHYFAFEAQGVVPDIVVLGKPIGNGHPLGVLITTPEIAAAFAKGPEFFSTFGGSTLSCRVGKTVLDIVDDEGLMQNAAKMGAMLMSGLKRMSEAHDIIGDVRGMGLFVGVELVTDRATKAPATEQCNYVLNRMREERILMGREGPDDNILKIRPPLSVDAEGIEMLLDRLDAVLGETGSRP
ncbi:aminotransferase class III-fold pyridoxal phosphate-dependent enzyme [Sulfitobacter mediterraneus]|uniref:aminotransferase class III-fold pyridoxal phosphate-dependent enzyme n=1 Tax=Sulfitobacter mediterraneus TaxID=83219 RepID=UPI0019393073|nr:aminotransferase class III-fold pyridoxal phosphate-dependent enzyme [Sulfitobacter mediterraneus]MBM1557040.1 aminotransferase class III-fold pyridoxal phosphate-dependent enzyme [Sulfitobacter mediterraneus]MBM1568086.1 aminotransferase class III-fold pyridoxal phosphate-dependent enzyme [Sulfitobacter mediterraneus]MBM1572311.1 aminotransferase class III-fold pyridoxal phosphate-dependent enzyme [Sulfitobacter mediterraneus]MBM1576100.1 aminotransferase class III-fold pyridoxal phosphate-